MAEFPSDVRLDATVGNFAELGETDPNARDQPFLRVAVFGDEVSDSGTMGLADDVRLLVQAFIRDPAAFVQDQGPSDPTRSSDRDLDIQIAVHGLNLDPDADRKLHGLIRALVQERVVSGETEK
ncbi:MAG: hypothetical protein ACXU87_11435 [Xanthobacteraceae bacterium]